MKKLLCLLLLLMPLPALAGIGDVRLKAFFEEVDSIRADFVQQVLNPQNQALQQTSGTMLLSRPGRFRWDYTQPYRQLIVANGEKVWLYDVDLEQVTVKKFDAAMGSTPALLLSSGANIEDNFSVRDLGMKNDLAWVELTPKNKDSGFEKLLLGFGEHNLQHMELQDSFGQLTRLSFTNIERNPELESAQFDFVPPAGVDVIGE
ncbi:outer membrane lipoprotein chaperone LolA [Sulfuriflexus sp.]|uniref:outer membrane lipoprotein chaperone LolA n=1 Tax=Sulfuriflexus sp. TaxID=2015443 RepID=UPI0028CC054D|nr:outer membrane lipoprotein chaperone LolA [Sulfuriflexus sp.]MDT8405294.1 outer membrane lipoprotein chaperone LolA [Sulfuriflexus sp.]